MPSTGAAVRDHRNAVRDHRNAVRDGPESLSAFAGIRSMVRGTIQETAHQYINAANVIINAIKHDEIEDFRLAHPALFLYRHAVELMLKAVVPNAGKVHHLDKLADRFKDFVKAEFGEDLPRWLMDRLRELAQIDPNSTVRTVAANSGPIENVLCEICTTVLSPAIRRPVLEVWGTDSRRQSQNHNAISIT
jgi:HEPN domain-containing protein